MSRMHAAILLTLSMLWPAACSGQIASIQVEDQVSNPVTRFMTGACLEDVNHEVYGGIYSQMLYGESFQEPASLSFEQFDRYGGDWRFADGALAVQADYGSKMVAKDVELADGDIGLEMLFPHNQNGYTGLIVKVRQAGPGGDAFIGYEISLNPADRILRLGRHRNNWEPISDTPCAIPTGKWVHLKVSCRGSSLHISLDGKQIVAYEDTEHPLEPGSVGLRTWGTDAYFRNLTLHQDGHQRPLDLEPKKDTRGVSGMWRPFQRGSARGTYDLCSDDPFAGHQSQRIAFLNGQGQAGIENQGLNRWGLSLQAGKPYEGILWARSDKSTVLSVALESADGQSIYAASTLSVSAGPWRRLAFTLTPNEADGHARFAVTLIGPGSVNLGYAFLQPGPWGRFKGLPVRKDIAEALIDQGLTVLRYGGCMVNTETYRWKNMIGPRDMRPPYKGFWFPYSSNGWGIIDFINFCRAAGFLCIPAFNMGETPQDMADFIEYVNGPTNSQWGRRRAADGRTEPYGLRYIQLGNEEAVDDAYWQRFKPMAEAIWARDPNITIVVGDFAYDRAIRDPYNFDGAPRIRTLAAHKKILDLAVEHDRDIWFDVHIWTDRPHEPDGLRGVPSFIEALAQLNPRARFRVAIFELNAGNHALRRALSNAHAINESQRLGDAIPVVCSANCLQPDGQNENGWDQGLLFLNPSKVWAQPPYYVTQMVSAHHMPLCLKTSVQCPDGSLDVTAACSDDRRTVVLSVVNMASDPIETRIALPGSGLREDTAEVMTLTGPLEATNTPDKPRHIAPTQTTWPLVKDDNSQEIIYTFQANSFTVLKFE